MPVKIALFGKSCVGKSTVATALGKRLSMEVRHCGELIKARAQELDIEVQSLPLQEHHLIDNKTKELAENVDRDTVIDGRFLNYVLTGVPSLVLIELACEQSERDKRFVKRYGDSISYQLADRDFSDSQLQGALYDSINAAEPAALIDTTNISVHNVVERIARFLQDSSEYN
jgi:cytidylate kinase